MLQTGATAQVSANQARHNCGSNILSVGHQSGDPIPMNMISEIDSHILNASQDEKKIKVAADTGACAHCIGPDDLPDGMMVAQCPQRNFCGPDGKPIEHFRGGDHEVAATRRRACELDFTGARSHTGSALRVRNLRQESGYAVHPGHGLRGAEGRFRRDPGHLSSHR